MKKRKNRIIVVVLIFSFAFLCFYIQYLFLPQLAVIKGKVREFSEREAYLAQIEDNYQNYSLLEEEFLTLQARALELDSKVLKSLDKPEIMLALYNMAKDKGLSPKSLTFGSQWEESDYRALNIIFTCSGPLQNIYEFMDQFSAEDYYFFALESVAINQQGQEAISEMCITAYAYKDN
ncbi:MAG: hypothetical protein ACOX7U_05620 [Desulfitobacteriia bacterium]|jgi:hypothetical protein